MAGRAANSGRAPNSGRRNFVGRIGATDRPPCATVVDDSGRARPGAASEVDDMLEAVEEDETVRIGENADIAEPGRAGRFLLAIAAFFWASIVSRREGFGGPAPVVLLENPRPGRTAVASAFLGEFGLSGAFSKSLCWVESSVAMMLAVISLDVAKRVKELTHLPSLAISEQMSKKLISYSLARPGSHLQDPSLDTSLSIQDLQYAQCGSCGVLPSSTESSTIQ